ncbi:MAG: rhodanese-like domain-containing protein [Weeksellaceae bacterium]|jgi:rhodanese-related sulfurtransferase|nr:rhodanese-like domain-containing protein [Weeksellaceae bacterium]
MTTTEAIKSKTVCLIDVRDSYELETDGCVDCAVNIPMGEIPERIEEIKKMGNPIVLFCRGGNRAASVLEFLTENGIKNCFNGGGFADVQKALNS